MNFSNLCPGCMRERTNQYGKKCPHCGFDASDYKQNTRCLPLNTILAGKYLVGKVLGEGGFGITYIGFDLNMEVPVAIKEYFPVELVSRDTTTMHGDRVLSMSGEKSVTYKEGLKKYVAEAQNVSKFANMPGVVSVKDFFYENDTAYIVMEYIDGISLKEYLKQKNGKLTEAEILTLIQPVLEALEQIHVSGIVHRDISPDNIMLTFKADNTVDSVKLIDFGAARMTEKNDQHSLTIILKHGYAPEEQYRTHGEQGPWTDVYAICATMYRMMTGMTPEPAMDRIFQDKLKRPSELGISVSKTVEEALMEGLAVKKEDRISSIGELRDALSGTRKRAKAGKKSGGSGNQKLRMGIGAAVLVCAAGLGIFTGINRNAETEPIANDIAASEESIESQNAEMEVFDEEAEDIQTEPERVELSAEEDSPGEQIVWPSEETMIACGQVFLLSLREDGTVLAAGRNNAAQCEVSEWENIAAVYAEHTRSAGLRTDGTVVVTGGYMEDVVESWDNITKLAVSSAHFLGLRKDGTVVSAGNNLNGCCETGDWKNVREIWADSGLSMGMTDSGEIYLAGQLDSDAMPGAEERIRQWSDLKQVKFYQGEIYGLKEDGTVLYEGEYANKGEELRQWTDIIALAVSDGFQAGLRSDGTIVTTGQTRQELRDEVSAWKDILSLKHTLHGMVGLKKDGTILVTEPAWGGGSNLEDILSLTTASQAAWQSGSLAVLCQDGTVKNTGYVPYYRKDESSQTAEWKGITAISSNNDNCSGITEEKTVIRIEENGVSISDELKDEFGEGASEVAFERKALTPNLSADWKNVKKLSCGEYHMAVVFEDGTAAAAGYPEMQGWVDYQTGKTFNGSCEVDDWTGMKDIVVLSDETIGLKEDGTLLTTGEAPGEWESLPKIKSIYGNDSAAAAILEDGTVAYLRPGSDKYGQNNVSSWKDMVQLSIGMKYTVGLRADGTVAAVGNNFAGQCDVEDWKDIVFVAAGTSGTIGITSEGKVLLAGTMPDDYYIAETWPAIDLSQLLES